MPEKLASFHQKMTVERAKRPHDCGQTFYTLRPRVASTCSPRLTFYEPTNFYLIRL